MDDPLSHSLEEAEINSYNTLSIRFPIILYLYIKMQQQQHSPKDKEINPLDYPQALVEQLTEEYVRDNKREFSLQSSKILYQCFHPLKDKLQASYTPHKEVKISEIPEKSV